MLNSFHFSGAHKLKSILLCARKMRCHYSHEVVKLYFKLPPNTRFRTGCKRIGRLNTEGVRQHGRQGAKLQTYKLAINLTPNCLPLRMDTFNEVLNRSTKVNPKDVETPLYGRKPESC